MKFEKKIGCVVLLMVCWMMIVDEWLGIDDIIDYYGENQGVKIGRKHISWYVKDLPDAALFRKKVNTINESQAVCAEIDLFFDALR